MIEIIFPTIERWHCINAVLENIQKAEKPDDIQVLCMVTAGDDYLDYVSDVLNQIFNGRVRILRGDGEGIEHDKLRAEYYDLEDKPKEIERDIRRKKLEKVYHTYTKLVENADPNADYYWFMEDDTLFPLDTYSRYMKGMEYCGADLITGVSYYWHTMERHARNFWNMEVTKVFGEADTSEEVKFKLTPMQSQNSGFVQLGASGLGNVISKRDAVQSWKPTMYLDIGSGADISFFYNSYLKGYKAYGMWDLHLPHITKHTNGDIEIRGRIDSSLIPILCNQS